MNSLGLRRSPSQVGGFMPPSTFGGQRNSPLPRKNPSISGFGTLRGEYGLPPRPVPPSELGAEVLELVVSGPEELFRKLVQRWELSEEDAARAIGRESAEKPVHIRRLLNGYAALSKSERERVAELFRLFNIVHALFRDREGELEFLRERKTLLEASILEKVTTGRWRDLQRAIEYLLDLTAR